MPWSDVYFLGSVTTFRRNGNTVGTLSEGLPDGAQWSEVVASGKMVSVGSGTLTFETRFFFTGDASNIYARVITYGSEYYLADPSQGDVVPLPNQREYWIAGFDWHQPGLTAVPPSADQEVYPNWFSVGAGYSDYPPPRITAPDGKTVNGSSIITSASAHFSAADMGASVTASQQALAPGTTIIGVDAAANTATLNLPSIANTSVNSFVITRVTNVPNVGDPYGYNAETITIGDQSDPGSYIRINSGWRSASIAVYAPLASDFQGGRAFGIKGGMTRCRDMSNSGNTVTSAHWGFPHADYDRMFGIIQAQSSQYGWGVGIVSFLWVPTAVPVTPPHRFPGPFPHWRGVGLKSEWTRRPRPRHEPSS
jgi:hypothetical protein